MLCPAASGNGVGVETCTIVPVFPLQGPHRAHNLILTEEGIKIEKVGIPPEASQFLQTRQHQINEVAREFNLPPTLIGGNLEGGLTYANSLAESQRLVDQCLIPWATLWEQELDRKLLTTAERVTLYFEISFESLLRGDTTTRYGAYKTALEAGFMTVNEVRARENLPALPEAALPSAPTNGNRPRSRPDGADHAVISEALARVLRRWGADFLRATSAADVRVQLARLAGGDEADGHTRKVLETALALVPSADPASVARALRAECVRQIQQVLDTTAAQYVPGRVVQLLDKEWPVRAGALAAEIIQNGGTHD
jgi:Phage portal protein